MTNSVVERFFATTPRLGELCSQNGWPDPQSLRIEILESRPDELLCSVSFDEVIMEGAGCEAGRIACWGRYRLALGTRHEVVAAVLESGSGGLA